MTNGDISVAVVMCLFYLWDFFEAEKQVAAIGIMISRVEVRIYWKQNRHGCVLIVSLYHYSVPKH